MKKSIVVLGLLLCMSGCDFLPDSGQGIRDKSPDISTDGAASQPNIILIYLDDAGYGDTSRTGANYQTPNIGRLAEEGAVFKNFYVAQAACSASRAALLTGTYPSRFQLPWVLNHKSNEGLPAEMVTLPEMLKQVGYRTGIYGKWQSWTPDWGFALTARF